MSVLDPADDSNSVSDSSSLRRQIGDTWLSCLLARCGVAEWAEEQGGSSPASRVFLLPVIDSTITGFSDH